MIKSITLSNFRQHSMNEIMLHWIKGFLYMCYKKEFHPDSFSQHTQGGQISNVQILQYIDL